jgi:hypothetical protein
MAGWTMSDPSCWVATVLARPGTDSSRVALPFFRYITSMVVNGAFAHARSFDIIQTWCTWFCFGELVSVVIEVLRRHTHLSLRADRGAPGLQTAACPDGAERDQPGA